jgi:hypothetical protein
LLSRVNPQPPNAQMEPMDRRQTYTSSWQITIKITGRGQTRPTAGRRAP